MPNPHAHASSRVRAASLVRVLVAKLVDQLVGDNAAAPRERFESINCLGLLHAERSIRSRQRAPSQLGDHLASGFPFPFGPLLGGLEHVVRNVESCSHASDASASRITGPRPHIPIKSAVGSAFPADKLLVLCIPAWKTPASRLCSAHRFWCSWRYCRGVAPSPPAPPVP